MVLGFARNRVHHSGGMGDGVEPEVARHLFFCEVCPGHVNHYFPMGFSQTIGRLALGHGSNNFRLVVNQVFRNSSPKQLSVTVTVEAAGQSASGSLKET